MARVNVSFDTEQLKDSLAGDPDALRELVSCLNDALTGLITHAEGECDGIDLVQGMHAECQGIKDFGGADTIQQDPIIDVDDEEECGLEGLCNDASIDESVRSAKNVLMEENVNGVTLDFNSQMDSIILSERKVKRDLFGSSDSPRLAVIKGKIDSVGGKTKWHQKI
jgi:hypothetical protein